MDKLEEVLNSPEALEKVMDLARDIMGGSGNEEAASPLSGVDPAMLQMFTGVMQEFNRNDDRRFTFLNSLRPYMKEQDYGHIDKAVQIMRLSRVIRHLFNNMGGNGLV